MVQVIAAFECTLSTRVMLRSLAALVTTGTHGTPHDFTSERFFRPSLTGAVQRKSGSSNGAGVRPTDTKKNGLSFIFEMD